VNDQVLGKAQRTRLVRLVHSHAGAFPGEEVLDLHSPGGFLAAGLAREAPRWHIYSAVPPEEKVDNLEHKVVKLPKLPFEKQSLAAVVGAVVDAEMSTWGAELASEFQRVLLPRGRVVMVSRAPSSQAPRVPRALPADAADTLQAAGFLRAKFSRKSFLIDGSEIWVLEGTKPV
jgi:hypothetical protein